MRGQAELVSSKLTLTLMLMQALALTLMLRIFVIERSNTFPPQSAA